MVLEDGEDSGCFVLLLGCTYVMRYKAAVQCLMNFAVFCRRLTADLTDSEAASRGESRYPGREEGGRRGATELVIMMIDVDI